MPWNGWTKLTTITLNSHRISQKTCEWQCCHLLEVFTLKSSNITATNNFGFLKDNGLHALLHACLQRRKNKTIQSQYIFLFLWINLVCLGKNRRSKRLVSWTAEASHMWVNIIPLQVFTPLSANKAIFNGDFFPPTWQTKITNCENKILGFPRYRRICAYNAIHAF